MNIRDWLETNLATPPQLTTVLLVSFALILVAIVWWLTKKTLTAFVPKLTAQTETLWDDIIFNQRILKSLASLVPALVLYPFLPLLFEKDSVVLPYIMAGTDIVVVAVIVWILVSFFNSVYEILSTKDRYKDKPIGSLTQLAKILTYSIGAVVIISIAISKSPIYLLSGLGAIAAVVLLVFKDSILGFVASIQLSANNMVRVGDWVTVPKYGADGDVQEINLTTIKVQNFDLTITTIPTYIFISDSFTNWRGMQQSGGRRIKRAINLKKETIQFCDESMLNEYENMALLSNYIKERRSEIKEYNAKNQVNTSTLVNGRNMTNIGVFRVYIENYLRANPNINIEMMVMVRQLPASSTGLPLEIYAFCKHKEWKVYENVITDIFDHLLAVVPYFDLQLFENPSGSDFRQLAERPN